MPITLWSWIKDKLIAAGVSEENAKYFLYKIQDALFTKFTSFSYDTNMTDVPNDGTVREAIWREIIVLYSKIYYRELVLELEENQKEAFHLYRKAVDKVHAQVEGMLQQFKV